MLLTLSIQTSEDATYSSAARVSIETFAALNCAWKGFVIVRPHTNIRPRVFRIECNADIPTGTIQINHWPSNDDQKHVHLLPISGHQVTVECVPVVSVRPIQYLELSPADNEQPKVALEFAKNLLRLHILSERIGVVTFQYDGIHYGRWRYKAYYQGKNAHLGTCNEEGDDIVAGIVSEQTLVQMLPFTCAESLDADKDDIKYQPIGSHALNFRELMAMTLQSSTTLSATRESVSHSRSILLHAPSGAGKTTLVRLVAKDMGANLLTLDCTLLSTPQLCLEDMFTAALRIQPSILLLEDLELIFPRTLDETKYKLICRLVACLDSINKVETIRMAVVGTVSTIETLHIKVRQLFAEEVFLDVPQRQWTIDLFNSLLPDKDLVSDEFKISIAVRYGQRPSHIVSIAREIWRREFHVSSDADKRTLEAEIASYAREISRSSSSVFNSSVPDVSWKDIGGQEKVKQSLMEMVVWPLDKPEVFRRLGISPPLGMILHGPPGTGKTMLAKAAAKASRCNFLNLSASDLMKAEFGESEKAITRAFDTARALSPCLVFIDEFQSLFGNRSTAGVTTSRMISQLLMEMDAIKTLSDDWNTHEFESTKSSSVIAPVMSGRIFVLAATNALSAIDPAFLQPGRFENIVYVGLPNAEERAAIFQIQRSRMPWDENINIDALVEATNRANAASLIALCQAAAIQAMQRTSGESTADKQLITMDDFLAALSKGNFDFEPPSSVDNMMANNEVDI